MANLITQKEFIEQFAHKICEFLFHHYGYFVFSNTDSLKNNLYLYIPEDEFMNYLLELQDNGGITNYFDLKTIRLSITDLCESNRVTMPNIRYLVLSNDLDIVFSS